MPTIQAEACNPPIHTITPAFKLGCVKAPGVRDFGVSSSSSASTMSCKLPSHAWTTYLHMEYMGGDWPEPIAPTNGG